jgi:membrane fusion protein, multidrug efflux system
MTGSDNMSQASFILGRPDSGAHEIAKCWRGVESPCGRQTSRRAGPPYLVLAACAGVLVLGMAGCRTPVGDAREPLASPAVRIGSENTVFVTTGTIVLGPIVSGELRARDEATVRAEVGGSMVEVVVDAGQSVTRGALLGRIETRTLEDARQSAALAVRSVENQLLVVEREAARTEQLVKAGAVAARDLDVARSNVTIAEAQLAEARARLASADRQLGDTVLRAPLSGVVSRRFVNAGDVVAVGTELFTIIDPSSMRLEASVPSEDLGRLRVGAAVSFTVRGYEQTFEGHIERIAPQADPVTRQVPIYVSVPNRGGHLVAGLFAEGRVASESAAGLIVPASAVNTSGPKPSVVRLKDGTTERVEVSLGLRDPRTERVQILEGVQERDMLLIGAAQGITPGTPVELTR